jgi:hypothetical protein
VGWPGIWILFGVGSQGVTEKHPDPESPIDPATAAAERIVEHLERSRYEVRERADKPRGHRTP